MKYGKVLHCDGTVTKVYYVSDYTGYLVTYEKQEGVWVEAGWQTV